MGRDKALLELGGRSLLQITAEKAARHADEILVVGRGGGLPPMKGLRFVPDLAGAGGEKSSMRGLHSALSQASGPFVLVLSCDTPFLDERLISFLLSLKEGADIVIPQIDGVYETLCAVYRKDLAAATERLLAAGRLKLAALLREPLAVRVVRPEDCPFNLNPDSFFNVNNAEDYREAQKRLHARSQ